MMRFDDEANQFEPRVRLQGRYLFPPTIAI